MHGPFHRIGDSSETVRRIVETDELWGAAPRNIFRSSIPKVKAYQGPLPDSASGFEFETEVPPDVGWVPGKPTWPAVPFRPGIAADGEFAKTKVRIIKQKVI